MHQETLPGVSESQARVGRRRTWPKRATWYSGRLDVVVHMEQVARVELLFDLGQPLVIAPVVLLDPALVILDRKLMYPPLSVCGSNALA